MSEWQTCAVPDSFVKNKVGRQNQIPAKDIAEVGRFPVVDQGQKFIAGYCDDESRVIDFDLPLIVFGDHTRCLKYIDFPFILGADGTKVLVPNKKLYEPRFYYFALQALDIPNRGYNRHFTVLNERSIPLPPLPEQKKIAHILSTVQRAIEAQERIIQTTTELKKALMHKLFTEGLRGEPQKQTEIGPVPESWELAELGSLAKVGNGSTPKRSNESYWEGGTIPWLNSTKIHDRFITEANQFVTLQAVKECHLPKVAPNSLLIAITGQGKTLGNSAITRIETCINQHLAYAQFRSPKIVPDFVLWFMQTRYDYLRSIAHGGGSTKGALTCGFLKTLPIPVPSKDEQNDIVTVFQTLEDKLSAAARKQSALHALFRTLLHDLMTAKTRVHKLEIPELHPNTSWVENEPLLRGLFWSHVSRASCARVGTGCRR
jgi:type I restriction enzyme, S subunit